MNEDESQVMGQMNSEKGRANFGVRQLPVFNQPKPEWSNRESFSDIQGMSGLNTSVSKTFLLEKGHMGY